LENVSRKKGPHLLVLSLLLTTAGSAGTILSPRLGVEDPCLKVVSSL
jgi:hypothetical protein